MDLYFTRREIQDKDANGATIAIEDYNEIKADLRRMGLNHQTTLDKTCQQLILFQDRSRAIKYHSGLGHITAPAELSASEAQIVMLVAYQAAKWRGVKLFGDPTDTERLNLYRGAAYFLDMLKKKEAGESRPRLDMELAAATPLYCDKHGVAEMVLPSDAGLDKAVYESYRDIVVADRLLQSQTKPTRTGLSLLARILRIGGKTLP